MACYAPDGKVLWTYPITLGPETGVVNGNTLVGPVNLPHGLGQMISLGQYHGHRMPLLTTDGLYIASILRDQPSATTPGPDVLLGEGDEQLSQTADGKVYVLNGMNERNILEVTGLESMQRSEGTFTITQAQVTRTLQLKQQRQDAGVAVRPKEATIMAVTKPVLVDGKLDEWNMDDGMLIGPKSGALHAQAQLAYDATNLYVACKVTEPRGFTNLGEEMDRLFVSGDCVDVQLGTDTRFRSNPVQGDMRLVFSKLQNAPVAVLYRAVMPGHQGNNARFSSGNGTVFFDDVAVVKNARVVIVNSPTGYALEAAIPVSELGISLRAGSKVLGDIGVVFADSTGRNRADRLRLFNSDLFFPDLPTEAKLDTAKWGIFICR
jgi:hypothetical protein